MEPADLRYHKEHEWVQLENNRATVGISNYAQESLGDIVYLELPKTQTDVTAGQEIGEIESTKTTSSLYTPVSGRIVQINEELKDHPELVNTDPYGHGWILVIELTAPGEVDQLMTAAQYDTFLASQQQ